MVWNNYLWLADSFNVFEFPIIFSQFLWNEHLHLNIFPIVSEFNARTFAVTSFLAILLSPLSIFITWSWSMRPNINNELHRTGLRSRFGSLALDMLFMRFFALYFHRLFLFLILRFPFNQSFLLTLVIFLLKLVKRNWCKVLDRRRQSCHLWINSVDGCCSYTLRWRVGILDLHLSCDFLVFGMERYGVFKLLN